MTRLPLLLAASGAVLLASSPALAQVRWDLGGEAGIAKRFTTGGASGASSPDVGPIFQVKGHVALLPMVRVGLYLSEDLSPLSDRLRTFTGGGAEVRVSPPLLPAPWRTWLFTGFGFAYAYDDGVHASGQLFQVPAGLGLGLRIDKHLTLFTELGALFGFGFYGRMYEAAAAAGTSPAPAAFLGHDAVALALTVGLSLEE